MIFDLKRSAAKRTASHRKVASVVVQFNCAVPHLYTWKVRCCRSRGLRDGVLRRDEAARARAFGFDDFDLTRRVSFFVRRLSTIDGSFWHGGQSYRGFLDVSIRITLSPAGSPFNSVAPAGNLFFARIYVSTSTYSCALSVPGLSCGIELWMS